MPFPALRPVAISVCMLGGSIACAGCATPGQTPAAGIDAAPTAPRHAAVVRRPRDGYSVYASFPNGSSSGPIGSLAAGPNGAIFGATNTSVFAIAPSSSGAQVKTLWVAGATLVGDLAGDRQGNLYGVTAGSSAQTGSCASGACGSVFRLTLSGKRVEPVTLYRFRGGADGAYPVAGLLRARDGALFGTTSRGGAHQAGTVYELKPTPRGYVESILYSFKGGWDGALPTSRLVADANGSLYGTTAYGGHGCKITLECGTVFELTPAGNGYAERTLHRFAGALGRDGAQPYAGLVMDADGDLYGTTAFGGIDECTDASPSTTPRGCGSIFKLVPQAGGAYRETVLAAFQAVNHVARIPSGLVLDGRGRLWGTTAYGGSGCSRFTVGSSGTLGCGEIFSIASNGGRLDVAHLFAGPPNDGATPLAGDAFFYKAAPLVKVSGGKLFGATFNGGAGSCSHGSASVSTGCGTVYSIDAQ